MFSIASSRLVLLNADPQSDISNVNASDSVVVSGKRLNRAELNQLLNDAIISDDGSRSRQQCVRGAEPSLSNM